MNIVYNTAMHLMKCLASLGAMRSPKLRKMCDGQKCTFEILGQKFTSGDRPVWIHAASLGEFEQGRPLIERIRREYPGRKILLSFFSPSGYEVRKNYPMVDAVCYLPFDTPALARRFVQTVNPSMAIFVKYEFWGNYLEQLHKHNIPTYIISAIFRPGQIFFRPWGGTFRKMLGCFDTLFLQDETSKKLLAGIGITNTAVVGDTRFDRVTDIMRATTEMPEVESFARSGSLCVIAGSSWPLDEDVYLPWFNSHPDVKLIIAPHEFDDDRLKTLESKIANGSIRLSAFEGDNTPQALIIDCFGKLAAMYRYCKVAIVGGGFGAGIHNINEAAVYHLPVIFGPKYSKFKEAVDLIAEGGAFSILNEETFAVTMDRMLDIQYRKKAADIAGTYVESRLGATDAIYTVVNSHLS